MSELSEICILAVQTEIEIRRLFKEAEIRREIAMATYSRSTLNDYRRIGSEIDFCVDLYKNLTDIILKTSAEDLIGDK